MGGIMDGATPCHSNQLKIRWMAKTMHVSHLCCKFLSRYFRHRVGAHECRSIVIIDVSIEAVAGNLVALMQNNDQLPAKTNETIIAKT